jgi:hypothetical protein
MIFLLERKLATATTTIHKINIVQQVLLGLIVILQA